MLAAREAVGAGSSGVSSFGRPDSPLHPFKYLVAVVEIIPIPPKGLSLRPADDIRTTQRDYPDDPKMTAQKKEPHSCDSFEKDGGLLLSRIALQYHRRRRA